MEPTIMLDMARTNRVKDLLSEALDLDEAGRTDLLLRAAAEDPSIELELRMLIDTHARVHNFLGEPEHSRINSTAWISHTEALPADEGVGDDIGPYRLLDVIGEGGFGRVYRAQQRTPVERTVALKVIKAGMDSRQVIARFTAERQALALMDHPGIATVFDAGTTANGRPYFVMELVDGSPITEYCDAHRLTIESRLSLLRQVCAAVQHAHTKGVIHRDLKPSNVLVTQVDGQPQPKVIDFGIAKATGARLGDATLSVEVRHMLGTPQYMSPEQAGGVAVDIDTRSDVYSLGVLLYQLLVGVTPLDGARLRSVEFEQMLRIMREEEPSRPSARLGSLANQAEVAGRRSCDSRRLSARVRGDLDWITLKTLEKDRERRYGTPAELAEDLRRHLEHEPVIAGPPGAAYRTKKFVRRHRVAVVAAGAVIVALVAGSIIAMLGMLQARDAARQASEVNDFMRSVLTSATPERYGAGVPLAQVLDDAAASAAQRFAGHPMLEAEVRDVLSMAYQRLSLWSRAADESRKSLALWQASVGPDDRRTLDATLALVQSLINMDRAREADGLLDGIVPRLDRAFGPDHTSSFEGRDLLAQLLRSRGKLDDSERLLNQTLQRASAAGVSEVMQLRLLNTLTGVLFQRVRHADPARQSAAIAAAVDSAQQMLERGTRLGPEGDWFTFTARQNLASLALERGESSEAAAQCRQLLEDSRDRLGDCHNIRIWAMTTLADALKAMGETKEPADLYARLIDCVRATGGDDSVVFLTRLCDSLTVFENDQRWTTAEAACREAIVLVGRMNAHVGSTLLETRLAHFISHQPGRMDEADAMFRALPASNADLVADTDEAWMNVWYADHLIRRGDFEQAERRLESIKAASSIPPGAFSSQPPVDLEPMFIALYKAWNKPDKVEEYERPP